MLKTQWFDEGAHETPRDVMRALESVIEEHVYNYHVLDDPTIPDAEFDKLWNRLLELEQLHPQEVSEHTPTSRVGGAVREGAVQVRHATPMLSLGKAFTDEEVQDFENRARKALGVEEIAYACAPKFDGLACGLIYEDGLLKLGATRGDGEVGEDVTENIKTIKSIPLDLRPGFAAMGLEVPKRLEVRGEVYMTRQQLKKVQALQASRGEKISPNPRNAAAGALRVLDSKISAERGLSFFAYALGQCEGAPDHASESSTMDWLRALKFPVCELSETVMGAAGLLAYFEKIGKLRAGLGYDIDGVVYKIDSVAAQRQWGFVSSAPRWAVAHKFPPEEALSKVLELQVQVGRSGALTPVAKIEPVFVGGVTVKSVTLHNFDDLARRDVRVGDTIWVRRAGDVIPEIAKVVLESRPEGAVLMGAPSACPVCGATVIKKEGEAAARCSGKHACSAQNVQSLEHFADRSAMDIDGLGKETIEALASVGLVKDVADFYRLRREDLIDLPRMGEKKVSNLLAAIEASKTAELRKFIFGLGIKEIGASGAKSLANHFGSLEALQSASEEEIQEAPEMGKVSAAFVREYFTAPKNRDLLARLKMAGVAPKPVPVAPKAAKLPLSGQIFVVTGSHPGIDRDQADELIESWGAKSTGSVSKKTTAVVAGAEAGPNKIAKAGDLGIDVITWAQLEERVRAAQLSLEQDSSAQPSAEGDLQAKDRAKPKL